MSVDPAPIRGRWTRQEDAHGCGPACLAMITGEPYEAIKRELQSYPAAGHDGDWNHKGVWYGVVDEFLIRRGYWLQRIYAAMAEFPHAHLGNWPPEPWAPVHLANVQLDSGHHHFVVMERDGRVLDPQHEGEFRLADWPVVNNVVGLRPSWPPVPDEAAIERGADKHSELREWRRMLGDGPIARRQLAAVGDWDEFVALAVLRAALEPTDP